MPETNNRHRRTVSPPLPPLCRGLPRTARRGCGYRTPPNRIAQLFPPAVAPSVSLMTAGSPCPGEPVGGASPYSQQAEPISVAFAPFSFRKKRECLLFFFPKQYSVVQSRRSAPPLNRANRFFFCLLFFFQKEKQVIF